MARSGARRPAEWWPVDKVFSLRATQGPMEPQWFHRASLFLGAFINRRSLLTRSSFATASRLVPSERLLAQLAGSRGPVAARDGGRGPVVETSRGHIRGYRIGPVDAFRGSTCGASTDEATGFFRPRSQSRGPEYARRWNLACDVVPVFHDGSKVE